MATPGRRLRPRNETPLPALRTRASNAYGAQGKASLRTQVTTTATDFDDAFESAQPRQSVAPQVARRGSRKPPSVSSAQDQGENEPELVESEPVIVKVPVDNSSLQQDRDGSESSEERSGTAIPISAVYGENLAARDITTRQLGQSDFGEVRRTTLQDLRRTDLNTTGGSEYEPGPVELFFRTLPRYVPRLVRDAFANLGGPFKSGFIRLTILLGTACLIYGLISCTPGFASTSSWPSGDVRLSLSNQRSWHHYFQDIFSARSLNMTLEQYQHNLMLLDRVESLEKSVAEMAERPNLDESTLKMVRELVPSNVVLREVNGKYDIDPRFWDAFMERLSHGETASLWQAFLRSNEEKWTGLTDHALEKAMQKGHIVSASTFSRLVDERFQHLRATYSEDFASLQQSHLDFIESIAKRTALEIFDRNPLSEYAKSQLETLVKANQIHGAHEALQKPNYFSVGMGARIDTHLTSPTMRQTAHTWVQRLWTTLPFIQYENPPIVALQRWDEATDCWCSSPSTDQMGKAQLTVMLPVEIYPDSLVVEHVPAVSTLDIASAPRALEIWADLGSPILAQRMIQQMEDKISVYQQSRGTCGTPPTPSFVCIGKVHYEIHSHKSIQSSQIWVDAAPLNLLTKRISVRVTENYGSNWTCIYRLRMTGTRPVQDGVPPKPQ